MEFGIFIVLRRDSQTEHNISLKDTKKKPQGTNGANRRNQLSSKNVYVLRKSNSIDGLGRKQ